MEVNKKQLADIFGASIRTIQNWQEQGMPVLRGGGKGNEVLYDSAAVIKWYAERDAEIENEKLRREVEELRQASETDLQPGTIEYERHRLTRAQADAQELKNARDSAEVVETAFCTFVLSRIAGEIASILDGIPLSVQRRFPELENRHVDFLKRDIIKAMNKAAALDELIPESEVAGPCRYRVLLQAQVHTHILSVLVLIRTPLRLVHMDTPSPLTLLVTRKTPSKTSHLTIL